MTNGKTPYDPSHKIFREMLGLHLIGRLQDAGFTEVEDIRVANQWERVFERQIPNSNAQSTHPFLGAKTILVYTTINKGTNVVRAQGTDAIRVCGIYTNSEGKSKGLTKQTKVYRTGNMEDIGERMVNRMRMAWKSCSTHVGCNSCGAPMFKSKKGNSVCAEFCWTKNK